MQRLTTKNQIRLIKINKQAIHVYKFTNELSTPHSQLRNAIINFFGINGIIAVNRAPARSAKQPVYKPIS